MTNESLIKALRCEVDCGDCAYFRGHSCDIWGMMCDAADALEAAEKRIEELERSFSDVCNANGSLACERNELLNDVRKLEAQLPKEGEWIWENYCWHCSVCGENPTRGMGYVQGKNELFRVCPNCGARMDAESEADADYQASVLMQEYFERYEPTYNSEDGSM